MDDQLKARLIGAVILVALAVLLIPELLSGRKAETPEVVAPGAGRGTRTYTIDLTESQAAQTAAPEPKLQNLPTQAPTPEPKVPVAKAEDAPASDPGPAPAPTVATGPAKQAVPVAPTPATMTERAAPPPPPPAAAAIKPAATAVKGGWSVQVGAFGTAGAATKLVAELKSAGFSAYISPISRGGKTLHRVRVGPESARPDADKLATRLKGRNLPATVVAND